MHSTQSRRILSVVGGVLLTLGVSAPSNARRSIDPPVAAHGKLGQELFLAIDHRDLAMVRSLIQKGADPNALNGLEFSPLYIAAASHQNEVMEALLKAGAKPDATSGYGSPLTFAAAGGNIVGARLLLSHGVNVNVSRVDGATVLMMACYTGNPEIVSELLKRKAKVNEQDIDGATALIYAARQGQVEAGRLLLASGAAVNEADNHRRTPLMYATLAGRPDFVRLLLQNGANPNLRDVKGQTALLLASAYGDNPEVIQTLLDGGADAKAVDARGRTAASIAVARGHRESAALLGDPGLENAARRERSPREAAQVSLKLLQSSMLKFNQTTGCISCHQEGLGRIVTGAARDRGFRLDPAVQRAQMERIVGAATALKPLHQQALKAPAVMKQVPLIEINEVTPGYTWFLAGMAAHKQPANDATGAMAMVLARQQSPNGAWSFTLPRVPMQSSFFTFTALAVRSLRVYGPKSYAGETAERIRRAKAWLLATPAKTSEDRAFRLLGLKWAGASLEEKRQAIDEVRADQRPDGGWAQLPDLKSDAYATGQALYALNAAGGLPVTDSVYQRGVQFLLRTQDDDGSWFVNKRALPVNNFFDAGFPHGESQYASFNGTSWATMALLQTLAPPKRQASRTLR
jgi:ankyrin repeat protein